MSAELFCGNGVKKFGQLVDKSNIDGIDYYTFYDRSSGRCYTLTESQFKVL